MNGKSFEAAICSEDPTKFNPITVKVTKSLDCRETKRESIYLKDSLEFNRKNLDLVNNRAINFIELREKALNQGANKEM